MELRDAIFGRKSIRKFTDKPVSIEDIKQLIQAATYAPSACNQQGWKYIVITDAALKDKIYELHYSRLIKESNVGILVLYRNDLSYNYLMYKDHIQSAAASIQNILLLAYDMGIGSCWVCDLPPQKILRKLFNIPKYYDVIAYVALGYTKEYLSEHTLEHYDGDVNKANCRKRKQNLEDIISYNRFEEKQTSYNKNMAFKSVLFGLFKKVKSKKVKKFLISIIGCRKDIVRP